MKIEYFSGPKFKVTKLNPIVGPTEDMDDIEYWEKRLTRMEIPYAVGYETNMGRIKYYVFVKGGKLT